jgi:hypothetical protein
MVIKPPPNPFNNIFAEKHIIENLKIEHVDASKPLLYFQLLNQGNKRGK